MAQHKLDELASAFFGQNSLANDCRKYIPAIILAPRTTFRGNLGSAKCVVLCAYVPSVPLVSLPALYSTLFINLSPSGSDNPSSLHSPKMVSPVCPPQKKKREAGEVKSRVLKNSLRNARQEINKCRLMQIRTAKSYINLKLLQ